MPLLHRHVEKCKHFIKKAAGRLFRDRHRYDAFKLSALPVTRENLLDAWKTIYHVAAPASIENRMK